jgi:hypothetical protein
MLPLSSFLLPHNKHHNQSSPFSIPTSLSSINKAWPSSIGLSQIIKQPAHLSLMLGGPPNCAPMAAAQVKSPLLIFFDPDVNTLTPQQPLPTFQVAMGALGSSMRAIR